MAEDPNPAPGRPLVMLLGALALAVVIAWGLAAFTGCKHAGLV